MKLSWRGVCLMLVVGLSAELLRSHLSGTSLNITITAYLLLAFTFMFLYARKYGHLGDKRRNGEVAGYVAGLFVVLEHGLPFWEFIGLAVIGGLLIGIGFKLGIRLHRDVVYDQKSELIE